MTTCLICGAGECACKGIAGNLLSPAEEGESMAVGLSVDYSSTESTLDNAVYLDKGGNVVKRNDPAKVTKISRQEALRRGLVLDSPKVEPTPEPEEKAVLNAPENKAVTKKRTK